MSTAAVRAAQQKLADATVALRQAEDERRAVLLAAAEARMSRSEMQAITGLNRSRIDKILQRARADSHVNA